MKMDVKNSNSYKIMPCIFLKGIYYLKICQKQINHPFSTINSCLEMGMATMPQINLELYRVKGQTDDARPVVKWHNNKF